MKKIKNNKIFGDSTRDRQNDLKFQKKTDKNNFMHSYTEELKQVIWMVISTS